MIRYKPIREDFRSSFLDQAEEHLGNGNFHSAVRSVGRALGMRDIPSRYDSAITTQEVNYNKPDNNINNYTVLQNIKKILLGKGSQIVKMRHIEPVFKKASVDKMIRKKLADYDAQKQAELEQPDDEDVENEEEELETTEEEDNELESNL